MKTFARLIALLMLAAMMIGCFAGCVTEDPDGTKPSQDPVTDKPVINEHVELDILTVRHPGTTTDADELWFFKYMELWFKDQGYDVTINVTQTNEAATQIGMLLNANNLPDIIWGISLNNTQIMRYAVEEDMILDFTPYLNESLMPNIVKRFEEQPEIKTASIAPDNGLYGLPYINPSLASSGCYGISERLYFRQSWLDACNVELPTTEEEFLNVLRAFKNMKTESGKDPLPVISSSAFLERYLWTCMGFYGAEPARYGTNLMLKDGKLVLPAYTDSYDHFVTLMNTMYTEGLIAKDYFSYTDASTAALLKDNRCGAYAWWTLEHSGEDFKDMVCANPIPMGDVESVEDIHVSRLSYYTTNMMWASADTEYPELIAMMLDYIYGDEGSFMYRYGPKQGEDPLEMVDGWYYDENNDVTTKLVEDGTYGAMSLYGRDLIYPIDNAGVRPAITTSGTGEIKEYIDSVTGDTYTCIDNLLIDPNTNDGHWRTITIEKWSSRATSIRLPGAYLSTDDSATATDLLSAISQYVVNETAKFVVGNRPLSELPDFKAQLKALGVETYLEMMNEAYADWLNNTYAE